MCRRRENLRMFFSFEKYFFYTTLTLLSEVVSTAVPKLRVYERFSICWREIWKQSMSFFINNYSIQKKKQRRRRNFYNFWQKTSFYKEKCADRRENLKNLDSLLNFWCHFSNFKKIWQYMAFIEYMASIWQKTQKYGKCHINMAKSPPWSVSAIY
jgi:hypothetical protein